MNTTEETGAMIQAISHHLFLLIKTIINLYQFDTDKLAALNWVKPFKLLQLFNKNFFVCFQTGRLSLTFQ